MCHAPQSPGAFDTARGRPHHRHYLAEQVARTHTRTLSVENSADVPKQFRINKRDLVDRETTYFV